MTQLQSLACIMRGYSFANVSWQRQDSECPALLFSHCRPDLSVTIHFLLWQILWRSIATMQGHSAGFCTLLATETWRYLEHIYIPCSKCLNSVPVLHLTFLTVFQAAKDPWLLTMHLMILSCRTGNEQIRSATLTCAMKARRSWLRAQTETKMSHPTSERVLKLWRWMSPEVLMD